jgi:transglutaminase-like putative cysteine protease
MKRNEGDCFRVAINVAETLRDLGADPIICHGTPVYRGEGADGTRFWHAWVEVEVPGIGWVCLDFSNGISIRMRRIRYYLIGNIDYANHVHRFDFEAAREAMRKYDHQGPWVETWEESSVL